MKQSNKKTVDSQVSQAQLSTTTAETSKRTRAPLRVISFVGKSDDEINELFRSIGNPLAIAALPGLCMPANSKITTNDADGQLATRPISGSA